MEEICKGCNKDARRFYGDTPFSIPYKHKAKKALFNRTFPNSEYKFKNDDDEIETITCSTCYWFHDKTKERWYEEVDTQLKKEHGEDIPIEVQEEFLKNAYDQVIEKYL